MKTYSTTAAAKIAKCSADTIRRACQNEDLKAEMVEGKRGLTWRVDENALYDWIDGRNREKHERLQEHRSTAADEGSKTAAQGQHSEIDNTAGPQKDSSTAAGVAALQATLHKALEVAQEQRADRLEAERRAEEAEENAFRMARRIQDLMHEMESHKRLLSENVESLQEDRAKVLEQEAKVKELELARRQEAAMLEELHQHRAEEKAAFEQEKQRLKDEAMQAKSEMEALKAEAEAKCKAEEALGLMATDLQALKMEMASKEAEWAEQRKPWYKKLFGKKAQ